MGDVADSKKEHKHGEEQQQNVPSKWTIKHEGGLQRVSYLDELCPEAVENIVRFTSERPNHENWKKFVSPDMVFNLLMSACIFSNCCRRIFHALNLRQRVYKNEILLLPALRDKLTEIAVDVCQEEFPVVLEQCLTSNCSKLKRIDLVDYKSSGHLPLKEILSTHAGTLECLEISFRVLNKEDVLAIANCGRGLQSFGLHWIETSTEIDCIWKSIGETVQDLSISYKGQCINTLPIMNSCKKLRKVLFFEFPQGHHENLEALCKGLGSQLQSATFENCLIDSSRLGRIASACGNISLTVWEYGGCTPAALHAMGPRASFVNIDLSTWCQCGVDCEDCRNDCDQGRLESRRLAGERCENLIRIECAEGRIAKAPFEAFFAKPKQFLTGFKFLVYPNDRALEFVFDFLSRNLSSLETFEYEGKFPSLPVMQTFVDANPALKRVHLINDRNGDFFECTIENFEFNGLDEDVRTEAAKIFLQCKNLMELKVWCGGQHRDVVWGRRPDIKECVPAQGRNVDFEICKQRVF